MIGGIINGIKLFFNIRYSQTGMLEVARDMSCFKKKNLQNEMRKENNILLEVPNDINTLI